MSFLGMTILSFMMSESVTQSAGKVPESPLLDVLGYFVGSCWVGRFDGTDATDTHCFRPMPGGFVRDNHLVSDNSNTKTGETIFWWDADSSSVVYMYLDSTGGRSVGVFMETDSGYETPIEEFTTADSRTLLVQTTWTVESRDRYSMQSVDRSTTPATTMFRIVYDRMPLRDCPGPGPTCDN